MSSSFRAATVFTGLLHLAVGIWSSIVLSNPAPSAVLRTYVIAECFFGYFGFTMALFRALRGRQGLSEALLECVGIGLFIWNAVLLFDTLGGIPQSPTSPYAYFVYVHFFLMIAIIGIGLVTLYCICCGVGALIVKEATEPSLAVTEDPIIITLES